MLRKRIIFTLIYDSGFFNQSRNFRLQKVGNIKWLEKNYKFNEIAFSLDELIVLNASKENKNMLEFANNLTKLVHNVFIPVAAGGGIRTLEDAKLLFDSGADKIVLNTVLFTNTNLVKDLVKLYGSQSIIASIDYKKINDKNRVFVKNGTDELDIDLSEYINKVISLEIGEIYLNSINRDGTGFGYDLDIMEGISKNINIPVIIAGGAGNEEHLAQGLKIETVSAVATANLFNFIGDGLTKAKKILIQSNFNVTQWR